jgi:putative phosphoribosyl transferase
VHRFATGNGPGTVFRDRAEAGRLLAARLAHLRGTDPVVLALPRGGVAVAAEVADALGAPLDVALVRKLGVPYQPELAFGAIGEGGVRVLNEEVRHAAGVSEDDLEAVERRERRELVRQAAVFRRGRPAVPLAGRTVVLVDDGIATGSTARAACEIARARGAARTVLATPVAPSATLAHLAGVADEVVAIQSPEPFFAIGQWYTDFSQLDDRRVVELLDRHARRSGDGGHEGGRRRGPPAADVDLPAGAGITLPGTLDVPRGAVAAVVFAHGSGSSRRSPRNARVAASLRGEGLATLLFDLLTPDEAMDRRLVFDVALLGNRLAAAVGDVAGRPDVGGLPIGVFGASTGAAAAVWAATEPGSPIASIVSRGGRPDLAGERLGALRCPTLLIVGSLDEEVLELNRRALDRLHARARLDVVPGATHLFEEPGALEEVARRAADWFRTTLAPRATPGS